MFNINICSLSGEVSSDDVVFPFLAKFPNSPIPFSYGGFLLVHYALPPQRSEDGAIFWHLH